jgi:hypothetical protein
MRVAIMGLINLYAAWVGILMGFLAGAVEGLFFHREDWRGGYANWSRRMTRLGHISFFGIGFINLAYGLTVSALGPEAHVALSSYLLIVGAVTMPMVCYLAAFRKGFRHLFFVPAGCLIAAVVLFILRGLMS